MGQQLTPLEAPAAHTSGCEKGHFDFMLSEVPAPGKALEPGMTEAVAGDLHP